ncbi:transglutaminase-like domain-containing protein, partial [Methanobrevibacter cuticularis]|uniref:transglutaminase-like domain-containing protein n=1 Tax=Methanobrevibacter cuticularis TaxID=47311 RepID=UPI000AF34439
DGIATFNIQISQNLSISSSVIKATFSQPGTTIIASKALSYKTVTKNLKNLNTDINKAKKLNTNKKYISQYDKNKLLTKIKTNINNVKKKYKGSNKNKILKSLNTAYKNAKKIKALKVNSIKKATADKYVKGVTTKNKDRTFKEAYDYKDGKMQWFGVANSTTIDQRPAGLRWTTSKQNTTTLKGKYVNYVVPKTTKTTYSNGIRTVVVNESFQVTGLKSSAKNKYFLLINTTKTKENYTYLPNKYLQNSTKCEVNDPYIKELAKNITKNYASNDYYGKANAIYKWVQKYVDYVEDANYSAMGVLNNSHKVNGRYVANCVGFSNLIAALCRASGIPVKYKAIAYFESIEFPLKNPHLGHVYDQIYINGAWINVDGAINTNQIISINQSNNLKYPQPLTNGFYITHDNAWEAWDLICNHYLNSSHNDYNVTKTNVSVAIELFFKLTNSKITSSNQAYQILSSSLSAHIKMKNLVLNSSFIMAYTENASNPGSWVKHWFFYCYNIINKSFNSFYDIDENSIAYMSKGYSYLPVGTEIYYHVNGTTNFFVSDGRNITLYNNTQYIDTPDGFKYIFYPDGTRYTTHISDPWIYQLPDGQIYYFPIGAHLIELPDGIYICHYVDGTEEIIYLPS